MLNFRAILSGPARAWFSVIALAIFAHPAPSIGAEAPDNSTEYTFQEGLVIGSVGRSGRNPFHTDAIEGAIVSGNWTIPAEGTKVARSNGTDREWKSATPDKDGTFTNSELRGGYLYTTMVLDEPAVRILDASGHNMVYVNGEPRTGDPYSNGTLELPVSLHKGTNEFLFNVGRGRLKAKLTAPKATIFFTQRDTTLPDIIRGESEELWGALVVVNATTLTATNLSLRAETTGGDPVESALPSIPGMSVRKVPFRIQIPQRLPETNVIQVNLTLADRNNAESKPLDDGTITLRIRNPQDHYKQTFRSEIDGSIQYYAVVPPNPLPKSSDSLALFLSTHGASVEAMGQADAYSSKPWGYLVAPTNRRPYGFDWEDWGRADAIEVLNLAQKKFKTDPSQTYLTGHSMGGHGAWQLGVTFPGRFAAIAPSAGWISFWSYGGARRNENADAVETLIQRASTGSDTLALASNYLQEAIYILHGDADDNVPVSEARKMKERLSEFHHDFMYHEQPGAGHWWGNPCVDWPPIFNLFAHHKIPSDSTISEIQFATANPGVSASNHWVTIEAQEHCLDRSSIHISYIATDRKFSGVTENVACLSLKPLGEQSVTHVELDGDKLELSSTRSNDKPLRFEKSNGHWILAREREPSLKGPNRNGPFKEAFKNNMMLVYATRGTPDENAWAFAKARYDAETWLYRGNGAVDVIPDTAFNVSSDRDRGIVLYGNSENNAAWSALLGDSPVQVKRSAISIGGRKLRGEDLACLFLRPRAGSETASVAVVSGTGLSGLRLTERVPYFLAGVAFPDCTVFGVDTLAKGASAVRAAGYFGNDWTIDHGEFAWKKE